MHMKLASVLALARSLADATVTPKPAATTHSYDTYNECHSQEISVFVLLTAFNWFNNNDCGHALSYVHCVVSCFETEIGFKVWEGCMQP